MITKIVYVLASDCDDFFYEQCLISVLSARKSNPDGHIVLVCDDSTRLSLTGLRSEIIDLVSEIIEVPFTPDVDNFIRSRRMKLLLRELIKGDFLYVDCDTIIIQDLSEVDKWPYSVAAVLDGHSKLKGHPMWSFFERQNAHLDYPFEQIDSYFSGGVIFSRDDDTSRLFFNTWNQNYQISIKSGIKLDEPPLSKTNYDLEFVISELDGRWNCQVRFGALYLANAKILHFCSKKNMPVSVLADKTYLMKVKRFGIKTPHLNEYISNWMLSMPSHMCISCGVDSDFITSSQYETARRDYYNLTLESQIYTPSSSLSEIFHILRNRIIGKISPSTLAKILFKEQFGYPISRENKDSLNLRIYQLAFETNTDIWSMLADKLAVRDYVSGLGFSEILVPVLKIWGNPEDIDFSDLPPSFVVKCNHDNGSTLLIADKYSVDLSWIRSLYKSKIKKRFGILTAEPHYTKISPKVFAEELILNDKPYSNGLVCYKFFAVNGKADYCQVVYNTASFQTQRSTIYKVAGWIKMDGFILKKEGKDNIPKPNTLAKMIEIVSSLTQKIPFARVDLYEYDGQVCFSEITLMPSAGRIRNFSSEFLRILGKNINIQTSRT